MQVGLSQNESLNERFRRSGAETVTRAAVFVVGLFRDIQQDELDERQCVELGLPHGSTDEAVFVDPVVVLV
jgi:hypothetical protein